MRSDYEGWAWWPGARVDHYVRDGVSLCRRWEVARQDIEVYGDGPPHSILHCQRCLDVVWRELKAKNTAAAQWTIEEVEA